MALTFFTLSFFALGLDQSPINRSLRAGPCFYTGLYGHSHARFSADCPRPLQLPGRVEMLLQNAPRA